MALKELIAASSAEFTSPAFYQALGEAAVDLDPSGSYSAAYGAVDSSIIGLFAMVNESAHDLLRDRPMRIVGNLTPVISLSLDEASTLVFSEDASLIDGSIDEIDFSFENSCPSSDSVALYVICSSEKVFNALSRAEGALSDSEALLVMLPISSGTYSPATASIALHERLK